MITLTLDEIEALRGELVDYPAALTAVNMIEDCEGDLEDAALTLAIRSGQEPNTSDRWLDGASKRYRHVICHDDFQARWEESLTAAIQSLAAIATISPELATAVLVYVRQVGREKFCGLED